MSKRQSHTIKVSEHVVFGIITGIIIGTALGVLIGNIPIGLLTVAMVSFCVCIISIITSRSI